MISLSYYIANKTDKCIKDSFNYLIELANKQDKFIGINYDAIESLYNFYVIKKISDLPIGFTWISKCTEDVCIQLDDLNYFAKEFLYLHFVRSFKEIISEIKLEKVEKSDLLSYLDNEKVVIIDEENELILFKY